MRRHRNFSKGVSLVFGFVVVFSLLFAFFLCKRSSYVADRALIIEQGSLYDVAKTFKRVNIVSNEHLAKLYLWIASRIGYRVNFGEYDIPTGASLFSVIKILNSGKRVLHKVCIPGGFSSIQVMRRLNDNEHLLGIIEQPPEEGSIMPDTYFFYYPTTRMEIIARGQRAMQDFMRTEWAKRSPNCPANTPYEALILASIVEKETHLPFERHLIAGVFTRRLKIGMKLQTDPTVIYAIARGDKLGRPIRMADLKFVDPYNTYVNYGLPPTPIANPSKASILAALHPEDTEYLYFVYNNESCHVFSKTFEEHKRNIAKIRAKKAQKK